MFRSKDRIPGCGSGYAPELQGSGSSEVKSFFRVLFVKHADKGGCGSLGAGKDCGTLYSILFECTTKVRLSKQQDEDHERYVAQRYPTHVQSVTYPANTQAKEEAVPAANQDRI
ncbi:hypothetical protein TNCV_4574481 [Trichonephila clavipes]|nr:hypothetical protein TNCV_4574481 [Trichonephila clavipes]